jgi:hypothetical protein
MRSIIVMHVSRNIEARSRNYCFRGKAISIACSECVSVTLVIQHAKRMRRIILLSMALLAVPYFPIFHKRHEFREEVSELKICVLIVSVTFV